MDPSRTELERARQLAFAEGRRREELEEEAARQIHALCVERARLRARLREAERAGEELRARLRALERAGDSERARPAPVAGGGRPGGNGAGPGRSGVFGLVDPVVLGREQRLALAAGVAAGPHRPASPPPAAAVPARPTAAPAAAAPTVEAARLDAARARLRAAAPPAAPSIPRLLRRPRLARLWARLRG
jgi:hypothetical protein